MLACRFEGHLKDILRGVDPVLDPSNLPAVTQSHISNVNAGGGAVTFRATGKGELDHSRQDVAAIKRRMKMLPGACFIDPAKSTHRI